MRFKPAIAFALLTLLLMQPAALFSALTKSATVVAAITMTAGAADVDSDFDNTGSYRTTCWVRFTNGATGPTIAPKVTVKISEDTTTGNYSVMFPVSGDTVNSSVNNRVVPIPDSAQQVRFTSGSNTAQAVTLRIVCSKITAI